MRNEIVGAFMLRRVVYGGAREYRLKRMVDVVLASIGIIVSLPLWLVIGLAIKCEDGGSLFYRQTRVGKRGQKFDIVKFRSMIFDAEKLTGPVWASENDGRVTRVGKILRATALDELPQLCNILKGDISFVGPRPERPELVEKFRKEVLGYELRFIVMPGLTGLAQVYGRYDSNPRHKLRYERLYIKNQCLSLDMKLIALSFWITLRGRWESRLRKF